jgi:hypothetical protein
MNTEYIHHYIMNDKLNIADKWIQAGLEHFTLTGKVELNKISISVGLSKSSFYNLYHVDKGRKPLQIFFDDILEELDRRMDDIMTQGEQIIFNKPVPESYREGIKVIMKNYSVYRSLGVLSTLHHNKKAHQIFDKCHARLVPMVKHLIHQMYPEIQEAVLDTAVAGLLYGGTLFMLKEPNLHAFAEFAHNTYDNLYYASLKHRKP